MAAWTVGLVLGMRDLSRQGLFIIGGTLADRLGYKSDIVAGCVPRTAGFAVVTTGLDGGYAFRTIRPSAYQVSPERWRPAHIHFSVTGKTEQLVTQMYFKGERYNETDSWLNSAARKEALIVDPRPRADESNALEVTFDIVLMKG